MATNSSLLEKLQDISTGIIDAYVAIDEKEGTFDGHRNVMNLPEAIQSIPLVMTLADYDIILLIANTL